ncbi:MAG: hypothetical protein IPG22_04365 [Acidobacteria bacterium]|nr:hypothetical protein [Acidobacteriota bacterium]
MIEVWEKLDCESIGAAEIEAIETVVADQYGRSAVDSPMVIARLLADEGAQLRHSEIMSLYVERASDRPYDAALRNILSTSSLAATERSLRELENLRRKYKAENDKEGLRLVRETAIEGRKNVVKLVEKPNASEEARPLNEEIANWLRIWLETPEIFEQWVDIRRSSPDFVQMFGDDAEARA